MSLIDGTYTTYPTKGRKEALANSIYNIAPYKTPFMSSVERIDATGTLEEWQTDDLESVDTGNARLEGDEFSFVTPSASVRVGNHCQILGKTASVSKTNEAVSKAGRSSEMAYQVMLKGKALKRDEESIYLENQPGNAGGVGTARKMATMGAWVKTNVDFDTTSGVNPSWTAGVPAAGRTDSSHKRPFTETIGKNVMQLCYDNGGEPTTLMVGSYNKTVASTFVGIADRNFNLNSVSGQVATISSVDVWKTDFGTLRIVANRLQRKADGWFLDFDQIQIPVLRALNADELAKTGDAIKRALVTELTLKVKAEKGLGLAADLTTVAA